MNEHDETRMLLNTTYYDSQSLQQKWVQHIVKMYQLADLAIKGDLISKQN